MNNLMNTFVNEDIHLQNDKLVFDFSSNKPEYQTTRFGKSTKMTPFLSKIKVKQNDIGYQIPCYSVYKFSGDAYSTVYRAVKALSKDKNRFTDNPKYSEFINRTVVYIKSKILANNPVDVILVPETSSNLLSDITDRINEVFPNIQIISNAFEKVPPEDVKIVPTDDNDLLIALKKEKQRMINRGKFEAKLILKRLLKMFTGLYNLTVNPKQLKNKNILVLDDSTSTFTTIINCYDTLLLNGCNPDNIIGITIFKASK